MARTLRRSGGLSLFFIWRFFLTRTSTHSSPLLEAFGLFFTGFLAADTSGLIVGCFSYLRVPGVDLAVGCGRVWLLSSTTSLFLGGITSHLLYHQTSRQVLEGIKVTDGILDGPSIRNLRTRPVTSSRAP